jgi:L-amino acid N-acyltransferase YncA
MYFFEKSASSLEDTQTILDDIYKENPTHWPNGLSAECFDGGLYMVRKQASREPVGFVGWQERREGFDKVGYYSIGILPKHRRNGFAKQAVAQLIEKKASEVDVVKALVVSNNKPSLALAEKLDNVVMDIKQANSFLDAVKPYTGSLVGSAVGGTLGYMAAPSEEEILAMYGISEEEAAQMTPEDLGELVANEQLPSIGMGTMGGAGAGYLGHVAYNSLKKSAKSRCWSGYEPVPGKAAYSDGSCRPASSTKKKSKKKKTEKSAEEKIARRRFKSRRPRSKKEDPLLEGPSTLEDWDDIKKIKRKKRTKTIDFGSKWAASKEEKPLSTRTKDLQSKLDRLVSRYEKPAPWYHFGIGPDNVPGVDVLGQKMDEDYFKRRGKHEGGSLVRTNGPDHFGNYPHIIDDPYGTMYPPNFSPDDDDDKKAASWGSFK